MAADGVSLPTTIAQMGSVAKTQARVQQAAVPVTPFSEQADKEESLKIQRVKELAEAEKNRINPDESNHDKRKRRRLKRGRKRLADQDENEEAGGEDSAEEQQEKEKLGCLIDLRV